MTGCYNSVRNALKQRGWIEKIDSDVKGRRRVNKFEDIGLCKLLVGTVGNLRGLGPRRTSAANEDVLSPVLLFPFYFPKQNPNHFCLYNSASLFSPIR